MKGDNEVFMEELPPLDQLTSHQKDELIIELFSLVKELKNKIIALESEIIELKAKLSSNSQNSHKPSSTDGFKRPQNHRPPSNKKSGGQTGHVGKTLEESPNPDKVVTHFIKRCPHCCYNLEEVNNLSWKKAQIFDIPELNIKVEEHLVEEKCCPNCQKICSSSLPDGIRFGVQYGPRIQALILYLRDYHYLSSDRLVEFFKDIFLHNLSEGLAHNTQIKCLAHLQGFEKQLKSALKHSPLNHADETGLRLFKKTHWLHVLSTNRLTYFYVHKKRGEEAIEEINILPYFRGILVHDHFKSYFKYGYEHALCNAHHLRELQAIIDYTGHTWAISMQHLLRKIKKTKELNELSDKAKQAFSEEYDRLINLGYWEHKEHFLPSRPKEICLLNRLKRYKTQTLLFMYKTEVPFDNNQAERDIRMMKLKMKISGCFRSNLMAKSFCLIRSYISTIKKNGMAVFQSLVDVFHPPSNFLASIQF